MIVKKSFTEQEVINLASCKLLASKWRSDDCLTSGQPWHQDVSEIWTEMTKYERAWYVLYTMAEFHHDWRALEAISATSDVYVKMYKRFYEALNSYNRDIVNISDTEMLRRIAQLTERRLKNKTGVRRLPRWSPQDIPVDFKAEVENPRDIWVPKDVKLPNYSKDPGPVRKVPIEEYLATRRKSGHRGVALEFERETDFWAKGLDKTTDKDSMDAVPDWYEHRVIKEYGV